MKNVFELYEQLKVSKSFFIALTANPNRNYSARVQPKMKFGKPQENESCCNLRHVVFPIKPLKIIQKIICRQLQKINLPDCMYGSVKGKNNIQNAFWKLPSNNHFQERFY